jgi:hypothetical protein
MGPHDPDSSKILTESRRARCRETGTPGSEGRSWETGDRKIDTAPRADPNHDHGYRIRRLAGRWEFLRPDGTAVPAVAVPLAGNAEGLIEMHTRARLRIDRTTLTPDWYGERLDPEPILDALLPRRVKTAA